MPTENVRFSQSYVDDEIGPDGKPLCSAMVALLIDDPSVLSDMHRLPVDALVDRRDELDERHSLRDG